MAKHLNDRQIAAIKPTDKRQVIAVPQLSNLYLRIQPSGAKSFWMMARNPAGVRVDALVGDQAVMPVATACDRARVMIQRVRDGLPAVEPQADSFGVISDQWFKRHVEQKGLRSAGEYRRVLDSYVLPFWKDREFISIKRSDVTSLLDKIEDKHSPRQAQYALATIRAIGNWYEARHDDYRSPIAKGMKRVEPKETARERTLTDDEIRAVWAAASKSGAYGAMVKFALLTGQRQDKIVTMKWSDVIDGVWIIKTEDREKGNAGELVLPGMAMAIVDAQPVMNHSPYVFAGRGSRPFSGFSKGKIRIDKLSGVDDWVFHDLRRTARTLMSRAGVTSDHAERTVGHAIDGVEGVYDRWQYRAETAAAVAKLDALLTEILAGGADVAPAAPDEALVD
jgi:integrase